MVYAVECCRVLRLVWVSGMPAATWLITCLSPFCDWYSWESSAALFTCPMRQVSPELLSGRHWDYQGTKDITQTSRLSVQIKGNKASGLLRLSSPTAHRYRLSLYYTVMRYHQIWETK